MRKILLVILLVAAVLGVGAVWYWSPYAALNSMRSAVRDGDAERLDAHIDYPKLRESLKAQLAATVQREVAAASGADSEMERAGIKLGGVLGQAMVGGMVDALVRPEALMLAMQSGKLAPRGERQAAGNADANAKGEAKADVKSAADAFDQAPPSWQVTRENADLVIVYTGDEQAPVSGQTGFVLTREGFAHWKLTGIRLPSAERN